MCRVCAINNGALRIKAASGGVYAGICAGTAAWLDVSTVSGRVRSGEAFESARQTRPFRIARPGRYSEYRLRLAAPGRLPLAEIELLAPSAVQ